MIMRRLIRRDMKSVLDIEHASYKEGWNEKDFLQQLRQRHTTGMIAESGDLITGYTIYELHKIRYNIVNIAVHPNLRRLNIGSMMINKLINSQHKTRTALITVDIWDTNLEAQLFFKHLGFKAVRVEKDIYRFERRRQCGTRPETIY